MSDGNVSGPAAKHFFTDLLLGLHLHGGHDSVASNIINIALQVYETLVRPGVIVIPV